MPTKRTFMDNQGRVVAGDDPAATWCRETVTDEDGRLVQTGTYFTGEYRPEPAEAQAVPKKKGARKTAGR